MVRTNSKSTQIVLQTIWRSFFLLFCLKIHFQARIAVSGWVSAVPIFHTYCRPSFDVPKSEKAFISAFTGNCPKPTLHLKTLSSVHLVCAEAFVLIFHHSAAEHGLTAGIALLQISLAISISQKTLKWRRFLLMLWDLITYYTLYNTTPNTSVKKSNFDQTLEQHCSSRPTDFRQTFFFFSIRTITPLGPSAVIYSLPNTEFL